MPITSSAKKALRASKKKRVFNMVRKAKVDQAVKSIKKAIANKMLDEARVALKLAYQALDKAAKANYITDNAASRRKSRLSALVKKHAGK